MATSMQDSLPTDDRPFIFRVGDLLESRLARAGLSVLAIASLLPLGSSDVMLRPVFLACFGADLLVRLLVWRADTHGTREVTVGSVAFAVVDTLAFVSFLPLELWVNDRELLSLLALLRLTRLFMLLRFGRGLIRDLYAIITRREQLQTLAFVGGAVFVLSLLSAIILSQLTAHVGAGDTRAPFRERFWWAFRQLESADNLVQTLEGEPVIIVLSLALTVTGVFLVAFVIGVGSNVVDQLVRAERRRDLTYRGHTVVIGAVHEGEELIREFVRIYAKNRQVPSPERLFTWLRFMRPTGTRTFPRVALLAREDDMPEFLVEPIMRWVVYRQGDESEPESLQRISAKHAKRAIFLAQRSLGLETDAVTISALAALRAENPACQAYVEVDDAESKDIVLQVGGNNTVALDMPRFLGMFLCQHLLMPGVESLYRDLLTSAGVEIYTHIFTDDAEYAGLAQRTPTIRFEDVVAAAATTACTSLACILGHKPPGEMPWASLRWRVWSSGSTPPMTSSTTPFWIWEEAAAPSRRELCAASSASRKPTFPCGRWRPSCAAAQSRPPPAATKTTSLRSQQRCWCRPRVQRESSWWEPLIRCQRCCGSCRFLCPASMCCSACHRAAASAPRWDVAWPTWALASAPTIPCPASLAAPSTCCVEGA
jgi:hypothetical protein